MAGGLDAGVQKVNLVIGALALAFLAGWLLLMAMRLTTNASDVGCTSSTAS